MAKASEYVMKKVHELSNQGDLLCALNKTAVLTRESSGNGGYAYRKVTIIKGKHCTSAGLPDDVLFKKCARIGTDQLLGIGARNSIDIYHDLGHHVRSVNIIMNGALKKPENVSAVAVLGDWLFVAETRQYSTSILVIDHNTGENSMTLSIEGKVVGIIPVKPGLLIVHLKEKIKAVDYISYPRVETVEVMEYGRSIVNDCAKGPNDELYVMFVKGVASKVLEIHVFDDDYDEIHSTKITHSTPITCLRAVFTTSRVGYLVLQMQNTLLTYKGFDNNRKSAGKSRDGSARRFSPQKTSIYTEKSIEPSVPPAPTSKGSSQSNIEGRQEENDKDNQSQEERDEVGEFVGQLNISSHDKLLHKSPHDEIHPSTIPEEAMDGSPFESGTIGEEGGEIRSSTYGFSLKIPPGAILKGQPINIRVGLSREASGSGCNNGVSIAPEVICAPSGLELDKPARIKFQHCLSSWPSDMQLSVHEDVNDERGGADGGEKGKAQARCSLDKDDIELQITRLGKYSVTVVGSDVHKKFALRPFIPVTMPATRKPIITVLIYGHTDCAKQVMMDNMAADSPYPVKPAHIGTNFALNLSAKDSSEILIGCSGAGKTKEKSMSVSRLSDFLENSMDFQVDCTGRRPVDVTIRLRYGNTKDEMICHVDIPEPEATQQPVRRGASLELGSVRHVSSSSDTDAPSDVPSTLLHEIGREVPHNYYTPLGLKLGLEKAKLDSFLHACANDHGEAMYRALEAWKNKEGVDNREKLRNLLIEADLRRIAEKYLSR